MVINLEKPQSWPPDLLSVLDRHYDQLHNWEARTGFRDPRAYDQAINEILDASQPFAIRGWHCTRLTEQEIGLVLTHGLRLPTPAMLHQRIDAVVAAGLLSPAIADVLKTRNQADDENRAGKVWFCFFPPRDAGEGGIERFFRHWGGEALYNSHEDDPVTSPALRIIGTPALIEANVPISSLGKPNYCVPFNLARRFVISRGYQTREPVELEDCIRYPLPAERIGRVIRFPDSDFIGLTGCDQWPRPLTHKGV